MIKTIYNPKDEIEKRVNQIIEEFDINYNRKIEIVVHSEGFDKDKIQNISLKKLQESLKTDNVNWTLCFLKTKFETITTEHLEECAKFVMESYDKRLKEIHRGFTYE